MKRVVFFWRTAVVVCLLFGSGIAANAQVFIPPFPQDFGNPRIIKPPVINRPEISINPVDMSAYESYGLSYNETNRGYFYNGKLVGLFVDKQGRGITYLSQNGEIHVKVIRNDTGNLIGLAELSAGEYNEIVAEMDVLRDDLYARMENLISEMQSLRNQRLGMPMRPSIPMRPGMMGGFNPPAPEQYRKEIFEKLEQHILEMHERLLPPGTRKN